MAYEMVMPYHLHMPSYFLETFTEYPYKVTNINILGRNLISFQGYLHFADSPYTNGQSRIIFLSKCHESR